MLKTLKDETIKATHDDAKTTTIKQTGQWSGDDELFKIFKSELNTSVIGDILDEFNCYHQFLPQPLHPLRITDKLIGRSMPVLMIDVYGPQKKPFGKLTKALDQLKPDGIYVASGG